MRHFIERLLKTQPQLNKAGDILVSIPRIACGLLLAFDFGSSKFGMPWSGNDLALFTTPDWFVEDVAKFGGLFAIAPYLFAWLAAASETIGGLFLATGLKTRLASFMIMCTMLGAIFFQKWDSGLWGMLPAIGFLWVSLYSLAMGSGRYGLDFVLNRAFKKRRLLNLPLSQFKIKSSISKSLSLVLLVSCFSLSAQERKVKFGVDMTESSQKNAAIKGSVSPLSWDKEYPLTDPDGDGIFEAEITFNTSSRYVNFKFVNNGETELEGSDPRRIWFKDEPISKVYFFNEFEFYNEKQLEKLTFTEEQLKEDVLKLGQILQYLHPAIYRYTDSVALQADLLQLEKELLAEPTLTNSYKAISKFAAKVKCSHTFTNPWNQGSNMEKAAFYQPNKLPFTFKRIGKRLFIDKNASENQQLKSGLEILSINGVTVDAILSELAQYVTSDGNNYEKKLERLALTGTEKFSLFDIFYPLVFGSYEQFELKLKDNKNGEVSSETVGATSKTNRTKVLKDRYQNLETSLRDGWSFELINDQVGILKIKSFAVQRNEFDWKAIIDDAFDQLNDKQTPNLIIDIRENEGAQGIVGEYILERIIKAPFSAPAMQSSVRYLTIPEAYKKYIGTWDKFPYDFTGKIDQKKGERYFLKEKYSAGGKTYKPKKNGYKGDVYLLTDASNSSATHLMAAYAKQVDGVTLVGQETGGNQLGTNGSFMFFLRLPNTKVEVDIPVINMFVPPIAGEARDGGIAPDYEVEKTWENITFGKDAEIEKVLSLINQ